MNQETQNFLDVNAAAGGLGDIFTYDITMATCQCSYCGKTGPVAEAYVYAMEPGLVVRCNNCKNVLMRFVTGGGQAWLDLRGMAFLQYPMPGTQS
jgi:NAD-dependent SIR2 family protein deacetylase